MILAQAEYSPSDSKCGFFVFVCFLSKVAESLVQRDGDFLIRDSLSSPGNFVLTCQWKNISQHFKINRTVLRLNEAYCRVQYQFELESFDSIPGLVRCYVGNRRPISKQSGAIIFQPINRTVPLRCLEEKYGVSPVRQRECNITEGKTETAIRLSICGVQSEEHSLTRGNFLRYFSLVPPSSLKGSQESNPAPIEVMGVLSSTFMGKESDLTVSSNNSF